MAPDEAAGTFTYANPRTINWGAGCLALHLQETLERLALERVFLVSTRSVAAHPALGAVVRTLLGRRLVGSYSAIGQHAPASAIAEAVATARECRPDALLSLGGGSPIDAAKAVAYALATGADMADPASVARVRAAPLDTNALLPHLAIPTTLSAAEMSSSAGYTTADDREKVGLRAAELVPRVVFLDAELSLHTPLPLWLSTGIRAVDHAVETILAPSCPPISEVLALDALRRLKRALLATHAAPGDLEPRTDAQLGAWFSFTLPDTAAGGLSHTLGKRIGARHGVPHGVTSCLLLPHVMRYLLPRTHHRQARIAEALGVDTHTREMPVETAAACAADAVEELIGTLELPRRLGAFGVTEADLERAAEPLASTALPQADLVGIYRAAW